MKALKIILLIAVSLTLNLNIHSQEKSTTPERTPELEAAKQTEKIQKELQLNQEQAKQVHEINLKYARERQISNSRTEALERIKNKDTDLKRILKPEQYEQLKNKKYENSSYSSPDLRRTNPVTSSDSRNSNQSPTYRTGGVIRQQNTNSSTRQSGAYNRSTTTNPALNTRNSTQNSTSERTGTTTYQNSRMGTSSNSTTTNSHSTSTSTIRSSSGNNGTSRSSENSGNSSRSSSSSRSNSTTNQDRR
jgi:hypothetical protein